ncbi:putative nucleotide-diphospho-sugar transferase [Desulfopila aestuarii]|uniref:Nucleotide-diphospho-sugar transferase n=1 Tax=Desulfopila aestuarii DSM 18488 TaxID=1121416 RepID=A0A1M7YGS8_9BACT|nr:putative nucleotide-diphospho-sugar transferase [Desulfopila aestuarii]SHO51842.1 Nucleotide-diphospho-sugar transferase [Desulfopila aestuarii DSM 18488]
MTFTSKKSRGVLYIAAGKKHAEAARCSAESVRQTNPGLDVHIFTDSRNVDETIFSSHSLIENGHYRSKVDYIGQSPFYKTLYLDSDTRVLVDISEIFDMLDHFDIALAHAHRRNHPNTLREWTKPIPYSFPQLNGGVIAFRKDPAVINFFEEWKTAFHSAGLTKDQVTLRQLLYESNLRLNVLPPEYNIRYRKSLWMWRRKEAMPKILHMAKYAPK